jgi:hypothetical protein
LRCILQLVCDREQSEEGALRALIFSTMHGSAVAHKVRAGKHSHVTDLARLAGGRELEHLAAGDQLAAGHHGSSMELEIEAGSTAKRQSSPRTARVKAR